MGHAKAGDTVKVHYTGKLGDGTVFDTSANREPLEFTIGGGKIIQGFEEAVVGMSPEDEKTIHLSPEKGYGPHRDEMVVEVERIQFPSHIEPEIGKRLQIQQSGEQHIIVEITGVSESKVTLDANHPLAGHDLIFDIELVEIL